MGDQRRLVRIGVAFLAVVVVAFAVWLVATGRAVEFADALAHADPSWVFAGVCCYAGFFLLEMLCFRLAGMLAGERLGFADLASVAASGVVFGYLTPGQMGAAPAQIVRLTQVGLKVGDATAVQLTRFFIYQAGMTVLGAAVLVARFSYFKQMFGQVVIVSVLAFGMHIAIMAGLVAIVFLPDLVRRFGHWAVRVLSGRVHLVKDAQAAHARVDEEVDTYAGSVHTAVRHVPEVAGAVAVTLLQLACYYAIPFCAVRALGGEVGFSDSLCSAAFIQLVMTAIPLPGGTGGAEGGFVLFFGEALGALAAAGVVLWRLLSYYAPILVCLPMLGLRSKVGPQERLRTYGEAHVGAEGIRDDLRVARSKVARGRRRLHSAHRRRRK